MEAPDRIPGIIAVIEAAWLAHPELRLGQLLINTLNPRDLTELYYLEDRALAARIVAQFDHQNPATETFEVEMAKLHSRSCCCHERYKTVYDRAREIFKSDENTERWLSSPCLALGNQIPMKLINTEAGMEEVMQTLGRIEYGVYS